MNRKWLTLVVLVGMVMAVALPPVALAAPYSRLSCGLGFDSAHDSTECVWRILWQIYRIPAAGGDATLLIGTYVDRRFGVSDDGGMSVALPDAGDAELQPPQKTDGEDLALSLGAHVTVKIYDYADPSHMLFSFEGTLAELMALSGGQTAFAGPYGVVIRVPLTVPAGNVMWVGRMEVMQGGYRCHADLFLCQGVPLPWPFFRIL